MSIRKAKNINFDKLMNLMVITITKNRLFRKNKEYKVYVLYTPHRKRIYKVTTIYNKFPYIKGDDIHKVEKWCLDNKYTFIKRRGKA